MIFSISEAFSVNKTGVLEKSTDFATVYVSYGTSPRTEMAVGFVCWIDSRGNIYQYLDRSNASNSYGYVSPYYSPGLGYGAGQIFPNGDCSFSISIYANSYGNRRARTSTASVRGT